MASSRKAPNPKPLPAITKNDLEMKRLELAITRAKMWAPVARYAAHYVGAALCLLAIWPSVVWLAGRETKVDVALTLTLTIALTASNAITGLIAKRQHTIASTSRSRANRLDSELLTEKERTAMLKKRVEELESHNKMLRNDHKVK